MSELLGSMFQHNTSRSPHLRGRALCALAAGTVLALVGCGESSMEPTQASPTIALPPISAARVAASNIDGVDNFHFLPPIAPEQVFTEPFDATLSPVVEICRNDECESTVARLGDDDDEEYYVVNWRTRGEALGAYRISVSVDENELGHADVTVVANGKQAGVKRGRTLPIKFRIEEDEDEEPTVCSDLSIAHWPADGTPEDVVGNCGGVWVGAEMYDVGVAGQAFSFDGTSVEAPFNRTGDFTLSLWAKTDERLQTGFTGVFASADGVGDPEADNSLTFQVDLDGNGNYRVRVGQNTELSLGSISTTGDFQHIAVTWDGTNVQTYLNGVFKDRSQLDFTLTIDLVRFGTNRGGGLHFNGLVDEVQIFDQALTEGEILAICDALVCGS